MLELELVREVQQLDKSQQRVGTKTCSQLNLLSKLFELHQMCAMLLKSGNTQLR